MLISRKQPDTAQDYLVESTRLDYDADYDDDDDDDATYCRLS